MHDKTVNFSHGCRATWTCRLRRKLYCPETGKEFDFGDTGRAGLRLAKGGVCVDRDEKEIKRLKPESGRTIEIVQFVKQEEIDPIYFGPRGVLRGADGRKHQGVASCFTKR